MDAWRRPFLSKACPKEIDVPPLGPYGQRLSSESASRTACFVAVLSMLSMRKDLVSLLWFLIHYRGQLPPILYLRRRLFFNLVSSADLPVSTKGNSIIILSKMGNPLPQLSNLDWYSSVQTLLVTTRQNRQTVSLSMALSSF